MVDEVGGVFVVRVDEFDRKLLPRVGEATEVPVVADSGVFGVGLAVLALVATGVVQLFDLVVALFTLAVVRLVARYVTVLVEVGSSPVLLVVVVQAHLALMLL